MINIKLILNRIIIKYQLINDKDEIKYFYPRIKRISK